MVDNTDPRPVLRQELARIFKNQRVIRAFEKIFDLIPPEFIDQQIQIDTLNLIAELSSANSIKAIDAINQLTNAIERMSVAPVSIDTLPPDDITPRLELGTIATQQSDRVEITGGTITSVLTDSSTNLIASSSVLGNGAAAAAGTILNAPAAGNPTKWVPINDNGTTRYIPSW